MANPAIPRDEVHRLAEACSDAGPAFQSIATRLLREQKPLTNFFQENMQAMKPESAQVAFYMFAVVMRIFEQRGGRMNKVSRAEAREAAARIAAHVPALRPFDLTLHTRVRLIEGRAQEHILDEVLWALYEREEKKEGEVDVPPDQSALIVLLLWTCIEVLDANWRPRPT